jgi:hypothetical protein
LRQQLAEALNGASSNDFSPAWQQAVDELGVADFFGQRLLAKVEEIFARNELTPAAAAASLVEVSGRLGQIDTNLEGLVSVLEDLNIGAEELSFGEYEIGVLIPRRAVSNRLRPFAKELEDLDRILLPFEELTTGSRADYEIRSISSSAFQIFLQSPGPTAACIAVAIERVIALYKQLLEIRLARQQLKDAGMADENLGEISKYADEHMESGIETIVGDLLTEFGKGIDAGRQQELRVAVKTSLTKIANRIDRGYYIEVRAGLPSPEEEPEDEEGGEVQSPEDLQHFEAISERQEGLKFMRLTGSPILTLPEPESEETDQNEADETASKGGKTARRERKPKDDA